MKAAVAERVAGAVRKKEVLLRKGEFLGRRIGHVRRVKNPPRGNPPVGIPFAVDIAAIGGQHRICDTVAVDLREQPRREGEFVALAGKRQRFENADGKQIGQIVLAIASADMLDQAFLLLG